MDIQADVIKLNFVKEDHRHMIGKKKNTYGELMIVGRFKFHEHIGSNWHLDHKQMYFKE